MNSNIEHELVEQFRAGNEIAFELIFHKTKGKLKGFLLKVLPIGEDAESILHEIYLKLWSNRKAIKTDKNFETYLFAIARNLVVDVMRKRFQRHKLTPDAKWIDWETLFEWPDWFKKGEESRQEDIHSRQQGITT